MAKDSTLTDQNAVVWKLDKMAIVNYRYIRYLHYSAKYQTWSMDY